jgi:hypothetical protein
MKRPFRVRAAWLGLGLTMGLCTGLLSGCARMNDRGLRLFSTKVDATLIVNARLLQGELVLLPDRTGVMSVNLDAPGAGSTPNILTAPAPRQPEYSCSGQLRYTATSSGVIDVRCNDGAQAQLQFSLLSETQGYAYVLSGTPGMSLVFGMSPTQAKAYLRPPEGKRLVLSPDEATLELK